MHIVKNKKGFGLLEVLVSAAIIIVILAALVYIARTAWNNIQYRQKRAQAIYLAQEGIEIARQIRDTNWIDRQSLTGWDALHLYNVDSPSRAWDPAGGPTPAATGCYTMLHQPGNTDQPLLVPDSTDPSEPLRRYSLDPVSLTYDACKTAAQNQQSGLQSINVYPLNIDYVTARSDGDKSDEAAPKDTFSRSFWVDSDAASLGNLLPTSPNDVHKDVNALRITAFVGFKFNGENKVIEASEILTNWRPNF